MSVYSIPDHMPILSPGTHAPDGSNGACIMEFVSVLAGEHWSDHPATVHSGLGHVARTVNDGIGDRIFLQGLALLAPRFIGTAKYDGDRGPFMTETMMFHIATDDLDQKLGAWAVNRVIGYLPEAVRLNVQPVLAQLAEGKIDKEIIGRVDRAVVDLVVPVSNAGNARVTVHGFLQSILQSNRAGMYQSVAHAFFTIAHGEGKGEVAPMLAEWLDHFDALTGHSMTDTQPEPTGDDDNKGEDETPVIQYGGWTTPVPFKAGDSFTISKQGWVNALQSDLSAQLFSLVTK